jgi:hypothetical protein
MGFGKGFIQSQRLRYEGTFEHGKKLSFSFMMIRSKVDNSYREFNAIDNSAYTVFYDQAIRVKR